MNSATKASISIAVLKNILDNADIGGAYTSDYPLVRPDGTREYCVALVGTSEDLGRFRDAAARVLPTRAGVLFADPRERPDGAGYYWPGVEIEPSPPWTKP